MVLGGRLYTDMSQSFDDRAYFDRCIDDLYDKVIEVIGRPIKYMSNTVDLACFRDLSPRPDGDSVFSKPLIALTINEVGCLLDRLNLGLYKSTFRDNMVDGRTLNTCECIEHVKELGATITVKAKILFEKLLNYQENGVPFDLIAPLTPEADNFSAADEKSEMISTHKHPAINLSKKSAAKSLQNRYLRKADEDFVDSADVYTQSDGKSSFERYTEEAGHYYEDDFATTEVELWTCLRCGRDNEDHLQYCVFCATVRGSRGARGTDKPLPMRP